MRGFARGLSAVLAVVSLVLFVVVAVSSLRDPPRKFYHLSRFGGSGARFEVRGIFFEDGLAENASVLRMPVVDRHREFAGFHYVEQGTHYSMVAVPYWVALLFFGPAPVLWGVGTVLRSRRIAARRCLECGYDLRAHTGGGRCPECGAVASVIPKSP